jgi:hypothetical protein
MRRNKMRTISVQEVDQVSGGEMSTKTAVIIGVVGAISPLLGIVMLASYELHANQEAC